MTVHITKPTSVIGGVMVSVVGSSAGDQSKDNTIGIFASHAKHAILKSKTKN